MFNYTETAKTAALKFAGYNRVMCQYAIKDCHETLKNHEHDSDYGKKLWVEIDAARDRLMKIERNRDER